MTKYFSSLLVGWQGPPITLGQKVPMELESVLGINMITLGFILEVMLGTACG